MAEYSVAPGGLDQSLLTVAGNNGADFTIEVIGGALLSALRFNSARLLVGKARFSHRGSVCHLKPCRL